MRRQSGYFQQVVEDSVAVTDVPEVMVVVVVRVSVRCVSVLTVVEVVTVVTVEVTELTLVLEMVLVTVVVVVVVMVVSVVENEPVVSVAVSVVQKPHFRSHMPENRPPQVGQNRRSHASLQKVVLTFWHVASQSASVQMLIDWQGVAVLTEVVVVLTVVLTVDSLVVVRVVAVPVVVVTVVVEPVVVEPVVVSLSVLVTFCMQKRSPLSRYAMRQE
jgi:hypothetical protein